MPGIGKTIGMLGARAGILALFLATGGCSTSGMNLDWFGSKSSSSPTPATADASGTARDDDVECPAVTVRAGASTLTIAGKRPDSTDPNALDIRYQGSIVRTARECKTVAGTMTMKVGVEGRVVLGPAGGPGQLEVPLRVAVVHEGVSPKAVVSKLVRIPVTIAPDADRVNFTHIDSEIAFPLPRPLGDIDSYIVYVGFDAAMQVEKKPARPQRRR